MAVEIIINGQSANIENLRELGIVSNLLTPKQNSEPNELEINVDNIKIKGVQSCKIVQDWISSYGMHIGIPASIKISETQFLDYYVDLTEDFIPETDEYGNYIKIECKLIKRKGFDSFFKVANGTSFESLSKNGVVFPTIDIPYQIVRDNRIELSVTLSIGFLAAGRAVIDSLKTTLNSAALTIEAASTAFTNPGGALRAGAQLLINIGYLLANTLIALKIGRELIDTVWPKVRFLKACKVKDLFSTYCQSKDYTFSSSLLDTLPGLTILPVPTRKENKNIFDFLENELDKSFTNGYPTALDSVRLVGDAFKAIETTFNAKTKVRDGVVELERWDFWKDQTSVQVPVTYVNQEQRLNKFRRNTDEAVKRYMVQYQTDPSDTHTKAEFEGTIREQGFQNTSTVSKDLDLLSGLDVRNIPFALGKRKGKKNFIESKTLELFNLKIGDLNGAQGQNLSQFSESFAGLFGFNLSGILKKRQGVLQISEQYYAQTKLLYVTKDNKQPEDYLNFIGADTLYDKYHYINDITNNAGDIFKMRTKMSVPEFEQTVYTERISIDGVDSKVLSLDQNIFNESAVIIYQKPSNWAEGKISSFKV